MHISLPIRKQTSTLGDQAINPELSVFINCPFDREFEPILDAIIFGIVCCGFIPRSAKESEPVSTPRMERIRRALFSSKCSIHDFSRYRGEGEDDLARFNMPLEFGMAMALRFVEEDLQVNKDDRHDWLLLVPTGHLYKKFVSDLAGYDPKEYDGSEQEVVRTVVAWLLPRNETATSKPELSPSAVLNLLGEFKDAKKNLSDKWLGAIPWDDLLKAAKNIAVKINPDIKRLTPSS